MIKKVLVIVFVFFLNCIPVYAFESAVFTMDGEYLFAQAEDMVLSSVCSEAVDSSASEGISVFVSGVPKINGNSAVMTAFNVNNPGQYRVWLRVRCPEGASKITYRLSGLDNFKEKAANTAAGYRWINLGTKDYCSGRHEIFINSDKDSFYDCIFITSDTAFTPSGITGLGNPDFRTSFFTDKNTPVFPKKGVHPRLYVTKEDVSALKEKLKSDFFKDQYQSIIEEGNSDINCLFPGELKDTDYVNHSSYVDILTSRAFLYLIGDADEAHALKTIKETKNFLGTVTFGYSDSTYASRYMGNTMVMAACVYDWCYELMTDMDKQFILRKLKEYALATEVGYPAMKRSFVISHAAESLIYRDQFAVGIAVYDEDPSWYNSTASIVFSRLLPVKNFLSASGNDFSGNTYAQTRNEGAMHTQRMLKALGYDESIFNDDYEKLYYKFIYGRLPNGIWFKEGDDFAWDRYTPDTRSVLYGELFRYNGSKFNDPYILRQGLLDSKWSGGLSSVFDIISTDLSVGIKEVTELPMTHFTHYPMSSMTARTSWQSGLNAPTAMAYVNMRELTVGDHQHRDIGAFQLYYKGMLALDSGLYVYSDHYYNYQIRSVAHNVMLVDDPDETYGNYAPDGGQRTVRNFGSIYNDLSTVEESLATGECITAKDTYTYSGPDTYRPEFSYISSDIDPAYSDKIDGYRRSFVFVNLDNEDFPAALIVYDNLKSKDASFKKKWLLHSEEKPFIEGNTTVITRTDNGQNGKLINKTLIPDKVDIELIGGSGNEFSVNSVNYPIEAKPGVQADMGKWRTEISPAVASGEDIFLNVMFVTDADKALSQPNVLKGEGDSWISVALGDRIAVFPKLRDDISQTFGFVVESTGFTKYKCLFTGINPGKWKITGNGISMVVEALKERHCFAVNLAPGEYTVEPVGEDSQITQEEKAESAKEDFGDFLIRRNDNLMYLKHPTKLLNGVPYVSVEGILTQFGAQIKEISENGLSFTAKESVVTLNVGSNQYIQDDKTKTLSHAPVLHEDRIYVSLSDFSSVLGISSVSYDDTVKLLTVRG